VRLRDLNNTVIVVEHDEETIRSADYIVDLGPGAGAFGGELTGQGNLESFLKSKKSLTARYLRKELTIPVPDARMPLDPTKTLRITGAREHNLKNITVDIPLGLFTCITGVSGSGKSTLIHDTLYPALCAIKWKSKPYVGAHEAISGHEAIDKMIEIDQSPIGRTPRSNPATYIDLFGPIRALFANMPEAKLRGYSQSRFSFNLKGGRCEACKGEGAQKLEMSFLPDVYVGCEECNGRRYNEETLAVVYKNKNIFEVLEMSVREALAFFDAVPQIREKLEVLNAVGLGYVKLGQSSTTLSGGEAQRVKLAAELSRRATGKTLYLLDEPTTGLHFHDIHNLMRALLGLRDAGNTIVIIEHNLDVIKMADHIIDLGPEGGSAGGEVIATGTPEEIARVKRSYTGRYLRGALASS
jgi:excinuclease ABC subunit A